ncbi:MAG: F0F1 ATP synthase subunit delta [Burkholderiales bacterium]|nr:F0F1 ATP synthase subunit delta [Burkholderiales bacterium]
MAELATIARPYAEALFKAGAGAAEAEQVAVLGAIAADGQLVRFADNPQVVTQQVFDLVGGLVKTPLAPAVANLLRTVIDNGRVAALPVIAAQFHALVNAQSGVSDATIESAYPIDAVQLGDVKAALERRFGRKLNASVVVKPELIGGVRVVVGDEVLDTSVAARLQQMKTALVA